MINRLHMAMIELYKGDAKRIQHFCKVHSYARLIAQMENVDDQSLFIIETAALTHDIGIHICEEKYGECGGKLQEKEGPAIAARLNNIDGIDYQILVEADFLVNICDDNLAKDAALKAYNNIFKTESGKKICREMFGL